MDKLISHELPLALMVDETIHDKINDYMFVLLHKVLEDPAYAAVVDRYQARHGIIYLDNSCYELGESMSNETLRHCFDIIGPDVLVLPDVLGDKDKTIERSTQFLKMNPDVITSAMAVIQGSSVREMSECYAYFRDWRDALGNAIPVIGIPFVFNWLVKEESAQAAERLFLLEYLEDNLILDPNRSHHLLGTWLPQEFQAYRDMDWIHSIDTSNPIMAALDGNRYDETVGVIKKPKYTFDEAYDLKESEIDMELLYHNVDVFKRIVNER
tara:strand:+ start:959 stop:1765 length:807 start_codon:yes stop_codon:yes gene_type:complete